MSKAPTPTSLETIISMLRAGKDPDTGELHITEAEALAAINAHVKAEIKKQRRKPKIKGQSTH